ncbi:ankyrin repeat and zinc finger domain-containing protein 1 [Dorcoceras hygrometricum]|uniref:Ankyrin repeat and zinc finger domain-containing protein 1 n=1 Tax=Dorcoceras hygrometricum TaxID=472368 RepID=A0A2Z7D3L3_9LAMI|nr:ankyrin repeat and zinc finger domain-containing protein 1 [Dorcoceras hygrometricum]
MGSNPSTESNYKTAVNSKNKMQMLCMRPGTTAEGYNQGREPKNSMHSSTESAIDMCGHGECRTCGSYPLTPTHPPIPDASTAQPAVAQHMNCGIGAPEEVAVGSSCAIQIVTVAEWVMRRRFAVSTKPAGNDQQMPTLSLQQNQQKQQNIRVKALQNDTVPTNLNDAVAQNQQTTALAQAKQPTADHSSISKTFYLLIARKLSKRRRIY